MGEKLTPLTEDLTRRRVPVNLVNSCGHTQLPEAGTRCPRWHRY
jgi:hypothetical protein